MIGSPAADQRVGELREQHRVVRHLVDALVHVLPVVEPHADDLAGPRHDRPQRHVGQRDPLARSAAGPRGPPRGVCAPSSATSRSGRTTSSSTSAGEAPVARARSSRSAPDRSARRAQPDVEVAGRERSARARPLVALQRRTSAALHRADRVVVQVRVVGEEHLRDQGPVAVARSTLKWMCAGRHGCWPTASR